MWIGVWYVFALSCLCSKSRSGKKTANLIFIWMGLRICHSSLWNIGDWQLWCYKLLKTISSSPISTGNAKMKWQMECQLAIRSELPAEHAERAAIPGPPRTLCGMPVPADGISDSAPEPWMLHTSCLGTDGISVKRTIHFMKHKFPAPPPPSHPRLSPDEVF